MSQQKKGANRLQDLGLKNERKRQRQLQKFVQNTADHAVEKRLKEFSKRFISKKQIKDVEHRLDELERPLPASQTPIGTKTGSFNYDGGKK